MESVTTDSLKDIPVCRKLEMEKLTNYCVRNKLDNIYYRKSFWLVYAINNGEVFHYNTHYQRVEKWSTQVMLSQQVF